MIDEIMENNIQEQTINVDEDVKLNPVLDLTELSNEDLMDFYSKIDEHIKYLNNSIIIEDEEE